MIYASLRETRTSQTTLAAIFFELVSRDVVIEHERKYTEVN